jgi:hypothetical protein
MHPYRFARDRYPALICLLGGGFALAAALSLERWGGLVPCALCLVERWPYRLALGFGLVGFFIPRLGRLGNHSRRCGTSLVAEPAARMCRSPFFRLDCEPADADAIPSGEAMRRADLPHCGCADINRFDEADLRKPSWNHRDTVCDRVGRQSGS